MSKAGARDAILASALKLFGERGFDGVRTAEILDAAGQKNQTALQYHFGSREGLYKAILNQHLKQIDVRRLAIINPRGLADPRPSFVTCLRGMIDPLIDEVGEGDGGVAYLRFLRQFTSRPGFSIVEVSRALKFPGMSLLIASVDRHLAPMPAPRRSFTISLMLQVSIAMLATWKLEHPEQFDRASFVAAAIGTCKAIHRSLVHMPAPVAAKARVKHATV
jgi:AcrR family transcriptional regulator